MSGKVRLILAFHNHQPVGNFDSVFEQAYQDSYLPLLDGLAEFPGIPYALHISGSLLEWLVEHHPEYVDRVREDVSVGRVEILGGPFYEPILANIPRRDRIGQIHLYSQYLQDKFGTQVRGMWVPERVWEQSFAGDVSAAGISYTILDDYHFRSAGLEADELHGYYITEDEGRLLSVFPGSEQLRYLIPFQDPGKTIEYLRDVANRFENPIVVFGDDGEKFGTWPGTKKHVYEDKWLRRFLQALQDNASWLTLTTPGQAVDEVPPQGRCYLSDASYREMTEWVLPCERQKQFVELTHDHGEHDENWKRLVEFTRGGFWRNFRVKYPESNEMYARSLEISHRVAEMQQNGADTAFPAEFEAARQALYRAQCNCSYWHGAFGGLYLPHLRNAVYSELIRADNEIEKTRQETEQWIEVTTGDFNLDSRQEVRVANQRMVAFIAPAQGGHIYELDIRAARHNLLATLDRRPEAYHQKVIDAAARMAEGVPEQDEEVASIHDLVRFKQPDLDKHIVYDRWPRKMLVDQFLQPALTLDDYRRGEGTIGDFATGCYEAAIRRAKDGVAIDLKRSGALGKCHVNVRKTLEFSSLRGREILVRYAFQNLPVDVPLHFAVEMNLAGIPGGAEDRYFYDDQGSKMGTVGQSLDIQDSTRIGAVDEWLGVDVSIDFTEAAGVWTMPIATVSQSESGFELVHQSVAVVPHWEFVAGADGRWEVELRIVVDTSLARARELSALSERDRAETAVVEF